MTPWNNLPNFKVICNEILALSLNFSHKVAGLKRKPKPSVLM